MQEKCTFSKDLKIEDFFIYFGQHILMYLYMLIHEIIAGRLISISSPFGRLVSNTEKKQQYQQEE